MLRRPELPFERFVLGSRPARILPNGLWNCIDCGRFVAKGGYWVNRCVDCCSCEDIEQGADA